MIASVYHALWFNLLMAEKVKLPNEAYFFLAELLRLYPSAGLL